MGRVYILISCRDDQACLPSRDGTRTICRLCNCKEKDQCRTDTISGKVTCDCSNSALGGPFCTCRKCDVSCPTGFTLFDGTCTCYAGFLDSGDWATVNDKCHNMGAFLVKITSEAENTFVKDLIASLVGTANTGFWLGGNDIATEGDWIWEVDSTEIIPTYSKWHPVYALTHPNEHCLKMFIYSPLSGYHGFWDDVGCHYTLSYMCEYYP